MNEQMPPLYDEPSPKPEEIKKPAVTITISEKIPLTRVPEKALQEEILEGYDALVRFVEDNFPESDAADYRIMTRHSNVRKPAGEKPTPEENSPNVERPRSLRAKRTELYKRGEQGESWETVLTEAHARDEIAFKYITEQREIQVDMGELGIASSRCLVIEPPETCVNESNKDLPPIVLLGGWGSDVAGMEAAIQELVYQGRKVVFISQPDSQFGKMDERFANSVRDAPDLTAHAEFFKNASLDLVNKAFGEDTNFEIWGLSAGAMEAATMLSDPNYAKRVTNAVLVAPAGSSKMTFLKQAKGYLSEARNLIGSKHKAAYYSYVSGRKDETGFDTDEEEKKFQSHIRRKIVWPKILECARKELPVYKTARVREEGKVLIVSGKKDATVASDRRFNGNVSDINPQMQVLSGAEWGHGDMIYNPEAIITEIHKNLHPQAAEVE